MFKGNFLHGVQSTHGLLSAHQGECIELPAGKRDLYVGQEYSFKKCLKNLHVGKEYV